MPKATPKAAWVPPSVDPTDIEYPLEGPSLFGCFGKLLHIMVWIAAGYGILMMAQSSFGTPPPAPTEVVLPTALPTETPTVTPSGTWTAQPTIPPPPTLVPTATPIPPGALATWTPGAWLLTRHAATVEAWRTPRP
ncbi:MAG: hypothetical protein DYG88_07245 [Chloroflexi bacterium CFX4]|nr:hypothetical protein [Chloroflexi bacterium CFX4]MDL1921991.1 hypothetical protein [Chloroflexi bacterium CFX3]